MYVLIVLGILVAYGSNVRGPVPAFQEFSSKESCEAAMAAIFAMPLGGGSISAICVAK
jgi:hypothetical protein